MRDLQPQDREGDQHPVGEDQVVAAASSPRAAPVSAAPLAERGVPAGLPRAGQLGHEPAQVVTGNPGEGRMTQGRTSP